MQFLNLKIPPALVMLLFMVAMWFVAETYAWAAVQIPSRVSIALALVLTSTMLIIVAAKAFFAAKTTVNPILPQSSTAIVTTGIYKFSRNPMYLGFLLILIGWAVFLGNVLGALFLPFFVLYMNRFQIIPEECVLLKKFGSEYAVYLATVRRWI
ncbi:methyltransferase family protein [Nitrosomonas supralitoralis]|uniref:Isoprenylcysteine carboxylmethyltransferase family protein n=1 Tax=Nitrosomonas supralitoralis TaxID=2116706 RepID=A0A2P7NTA8_9PROT|nr:isoprenylcysteine carboxylmethyltransferase family protein [Nitrosomonas supralitoralis]PSJ16669.1 isoprenylcysteine carboxylmethyltransferase family protein [Nitrosomonas supralitoralis]